MKRIISLYDMPTLVQLSWSRTALVLTRNFKLGISAFNRRRIFVSLFIGTVCFLAFLWAKDNFGGQQGMPSVRTSYEDCLCWLARYLGVLFQEGFQSRLSCYSCSHLYWRYPDILRGIFFPSSFPSICNPVGYERLCISMLSYSIQAKESMPLITSINPPATSWDSIWGVFSCQSSWSSSERFIQTGLLPLFHPTFDGTNCRYRSTQATSKIGSHRFC